ncbi:uncharacterized protein LOC135825906 isoform X1 [Sycon ciliatum]|uniref:uncharacterized protein LOC135825906 isoform X1 n=1 Tax=Sycon ciliatum TaxID=27933 RepID=UPI0031F6C69E
MAARWFRYAWHVNTCKHVPVSLQGNGWSSCPRVTLLVTERRRFTGILLETFSSPPEAPFISIFTATLVPVLPAATFCDPMDILPKDLPAYFWKRSPHLQKRRSYQYSQPFLFLYCQLLHSVIQWKFYQKIYRHTSGNFLLISRSAVHFNIHSHTCSCIASCYILGSNGNSTKRSTGIPQETFSSPPEAPFISIFAAILVPVLPAATFCDPMGILPNWPGSPAVFS